jgi:hypothetical protein
MCTLTDKLSSLRAALSRVLSNYHQETEELRFNREVVARNISLISCLKNQACHRHDFKMSLSKAYACLGFIFQETQFLKASRKTSRSKNIIAFAWH